MSKQEFLQRLRDTLTGEVPGNVIEDNIRFYDEYISTEVRNGSTEDEVITSIGDPRLIAKTIMEASENASASGKTYYESYSGSARSEYDNQEDTGRGMHYIDLSKWYWKALAIGAVILLFFLTATILTGIFSLLMPLFGPLLMVLLIFWFLRGTRR
ncbi:DUF1700 domain-containing protein [Lacrimispora sp.]|jgi:uncharacterized membrane protein|uniref:DUF1700 domain-containing protein n=1 Tax=Lacrimispora sp. TaxID=2719234 RepID=UPI0028A7AC39|nr:DUF1700 domain-containing protein [Lacrimispora sp.]